MKNSKICMTCLSVFEQKIISAIFSVGLRARGLMKKRFVNKVILEGQGSVVPRMGLSLVVQGPGHVYKYM
jgi:hypothetical protein